MSKSLLKEYGVLFQDAMTAEFREELGKFASTFLDVLTSGDTATCHATLDKLAGEILEPDTADAMVAVFDHMVETGTELEGALAKEASAKTTNNINAGLLLGTGAALAPVAMALRGRVVQNERARGAYKQVLRGNPSLQSDPNMAKYFNTIKNFSPAVASDPVLLENTLRELQQMGPAALTVAKVRDLAALSESAQNLRRGGNINLGKSLQEGMSIASGVNKALASAEGVRPEASQRP